MMKTLSFVAVLFTVSSAFAQGSCALFYQFTGNLGEMMTRYSSQDIDQLLGDLSTECEMESKLKKLSTKLNVESNQLYKAMKYVDRGFYESARDRKPVQKIYQTTKAAAQLPLEQQSDEIWRNFSLGYAQMDGEVSRLKAGEAFSPEMLKRIHIGFYQVSNEVGDFAHEPNPGLFYYEKIPSEMNQRYWWQQAITPQIKAEVDSINQDALNWGLLKNVTPANNIPAHLIRVTDTEVFRANSAEHKALVTNLLEFVNTYMKVINSGYNQAPAPGLPLLSPMRLAMYAQKVYVSIHPFIEGNGRTSRFFQDMILRYYEMPTASSGDLMNADTLTPFDAYYKLAVSKTEKMLERMEFCAKNPGSTNYDCQELH